MVKGFELSVPRFLSWRCYKRILGTLLCLSMVLLLYVQYQPQILPTLNTYITENVSSSKNDQKPRSERGQNQHRENVRFLKRPPDAYSQIPQVKNGDDVANDYANTEEKRSTRDRINSWNAENAPPIYLSPERKNRYTEKYDLNAKYEADAALDWNSGSFQYNKYGQPVYEHGNRPNYVPKEIIVHLDLKGAPPVISAYKTLIPWMAKYGATSILLEYEEMFPWNGPLAPLAARNHYTKSEIKFILNLCKKHKIKVIPLVQTFGHLEFVLKHPKFEYLREVPELPLALCPSRNDSQWLVKTMIDQVMALHSDAQYLHIGCDEVYQLGECDLCRQKMRDQLFLSHVAYTAKYVRNKYKVTPIIWHDMLIHVSESLMKDFKFGHLVEPMIWVYAEDVYRFVQPSMFSKFADVFPTAWASSAFKGAFGEQSIAPKIRRHLDNNLNWLDVMYTENSKFRHGFKGLVLTGWQRHDHFAVLCELLPSSIPSLAVNLIATSKGYFNATIISRIYDALGCSQMADLPQDLNLDSDPHLWNQFSWCFFPGSSVFKVTSRLDSVRNEVEAYLEKVDKSRAWVTSYNIRHNFSSPMRIDQDMEEMSLKLHSVKMLASSAKKALLEWFDIWTTGEWIEQHIWPLYNKLNTLQKDAESMKNVIIWPARPLPLLPELEELGITVGPLNSGLVSSARSLFHEPRQLPFRKRKSTAEFSP